MQNDMIMYLVIGVLLLFFISSMGKKDNKSKEENDTLTEDIDLPYKEKYLLTKNEYNFYMIMREIDFMKNYIICPKVGLKDLFTTTDKTKEMKWFSKISQKHIDFLICDNMLKPQYAIELDDKSHQNEKSKIKDDFKNSLFGKSTIKLIRVKALSNNSYTREYIEDSLKIIKNESNNIDNKAPL